MVLLLGIQMIVAALDPGVGAHLNRTWGFLEHDPCKRMDERERQFSYAHEVVEWLLEHLQENHEWLCDLGARVLLMPSWAFQAAVRWAGTDILALANHFTHVPLWQIAARFADLYPGYVVTLLDYGEIVERTVSEGLEVPDGLDAAEQAAMKMASQGDIGMAPIVVGELRMRAFQIPGYRGRAIVLSEVHGVAGLSLSPKASSGAVRVVLDAEQPSMSTDRTGDGTMAPVFKGEPMQRYAANEFGDTVYIETADELRAGLEREAKASEHYEPEQGAQGDGPEVASVGIVGWPPAANELPPTRDAPRVDRPYGSTAPRAYGEVAREKSARNSGLPGHVDDPSVVYDDPVSPSIGTPQRARGSSRRYGLASSAVANRGRRGPPFMTRRPDEVLDLAHRDRRAREAIEDARASSTVEVRHPADE